jgi:hypothetical protein
MEPSAVELLARNRRRSNSARLGLERGSVFVLMRWRLTEDSAGASAIEPDNQTVRSRRGEEVEFL